MTESRLSPLRSTPTIPRLELSAITIGAKLTKFLHSRLDVPIQKSYIWSDSKVALMWTKVEKTLPIFINNRVESIRTNAPSSILRYVPGDGNPADVANRGMSIKELLHSQLWFKGPSFLLYSEEKWPDDISQYSTKDEETEECLLSQEAMKKEEPLFQETRFRDGSALHRQEITKRIERIICRQAQMSHPPSDAVIKQLNLYQCDRTLLWRCRERIHNANLSQITIEAIYLPRESYITTLHILHIHCMSHHCGV
ncbi:unnamed protein product [Haemonchus placei]|uniref:Tick transposon n=1 Tax=Haemonchus placei TaxID=6290 RepID=A0A0N4W778_HAEPC|nr:unnamed protein product [Haemonchus placei]